jgi:hypothetical protein
MLIGLIVFMLFMAFILALWEIQIEGPDGWAAESPGWKITKGPLLRLTGGVPLTGYHFFMTVFLIALVHLPLFFQPWSWRFECLLLGFYVGMVFVEDFFWFVLNPAFGLKNFRQGKIWWHKRWWGPVPAMYFFLAALSVLFLLLGSPAI